MDRGTFWLPPQISTVAPDIDRAFYFVYWTSVLVFVAVIGAMIYFAWKYRQRRGAPPSPMDVPESKVMEISWVVVPTLLTLFVFYWGFQSYMRAFIPPPNAYQVNVTASMWMWNFEYPAGFRTTGELVVPANRPVRLLMHSQDVIHSFFVPAFRTKMDVLPGRYTTLWFEATQPGEYQVYCTEYCGTNHSTMLAQVRVLPADEYAEWEATGGGAMDDLPLPELGATVYQQMCQACHSLDGSPGVGPTFQGTFGTMRPLADGTTVLMDENYVRESILNPQAQITAGYAPIMPPFPHLTDRQLEGIIEFIRQQQ